MVQAVIESKDDAWRWVIEWLAEQPDVSDRSVVTVTTRCVGEREGERERER
jgi:hypothetical protein